jgi:hypothetical protein
VALASSHEGSGFCLLFAVEPVLPKEKFLASCSGHYLAVPVHHIKNVKSLHQNEADYALGTVSLAFFSPLVVSAALSDRTLLFHVYSICTHVGRSSQYFMRYYCSDPMACH